MKEGVENMNLWTMIIGVSGKNRLAKPKHVCNPDDMTSESVFIGNRQDVYWKCTVCGKKEWITDVHY